MSSDRTLSAERVLRTPRGRSARLPLFLPVYQVNSVFQALQESDAHTRALGCICNAYFLYKQRELRELLLGDTDLHSYLGFDGLVMTDSGAFQQFTRALYLSNRKIVDFQSRIGADVISPLDVVTTPGDNQAVVLKKVDSTFKRVAEAQKHAGTALLAGVQQGGRFLDLRRRSTEQMLELDVDYLAIGSLVPFFNRRHDLRFVAKTLRMTREMVGPELPVHIYGAGDPLELPFFAYLGADIFDSASYAHYAKSGHYMTPFGALKDPAPLADGRFVCTCPPCTADGVDFVFADQDQLAMHNLHTILTVVDEIRDAIAGETLEAMLADRLSVHAEWFEDSLLSRYWDEAHG